MVGDELAHVPVGIVDENILVEIRPVDGLIDIFLPIDLEENLQDGNQCGKREDVEPLAQEIQDDGPHEVGLVGTNISPYDLEKLFYHIIIIR